MEITSKQLLSSAENFIRRKEINVKTNISTPKIDLKEPVEDSKIIEIYENLKTIQNLYTKEQVRFQYLKENPDAIHSNLKFNNEILFPELLENKDFNKDELLNKTIKNLDEIKLMLKKLEIQQENYFAANFISPKELNLEDLSLNITKLNPERVTQLTRTQFTG